VKGVRIYPAPGHRELRHMVLTRPRAEPSMRFLSVGSHLCTWASFRQSLAGLPLPSASGYPDDIGSSHRGLSPHKLMPMSGVHLAMHRTGSSRLRRLLPAGDRRRHAAPSAGWHSSRDGRCGQKESFVAASQFARKPSFQGTAQQIFEAFDLCQ
jgi:hypothetical protein